MHSQLTPGGGARTPVTVRTFTQRFSSTRRGARLARYLALQQLDVWGFPYGGEVSEAVALIVGELAANAATHGRVPGRDFELRLMRMPGSARPGTLRIEVADTRTEKRPPDPGTCAPPPPDSETGRGLLLVAALATRWTVLDRVPVGKVVRAELDL
ncbi:ATP-binding protein [Streptomyces caniferus]|uniref:ATP-binding protein n=1 Tax=Streptomyces caniferus TaxID=285557 RepID=A0A640SG40_9ACTN|nr:ATP-binding protein [Streptomyces caniferus]GFE09502.1 ATP-binding protein [Streptomyces caniferus]